MKGVPFAVGTVRVPVGSAVLPITTVAIKVDAVAAGVAEHAVKDDRDAVLFCLGTQLGKVLLGA